MKYKPLDERIANYQPNPVDLSDIVISDELLELKEFIARNVHEAWAQSRMSQGWHYGTQRDDSKRTHPCLVPYEMLSEEEKDYDRQTAFETLKLIQKQGFIIVKPNPS